MNAHDTKQIGRFTVTVYYDEYGQGLSDAVNDEPVMLCDMRGNLILDQSKLNFPSLAVLRAFEEGDTLGELCDMSYTDHGKTDSGNLWAEHADWDKRRYFGKSYDAMTRALFRAEYGREMSDLRVEQFGNGFYYLCFWQSEFDKYCGGKDCKSSVKSCQAIIDGDVFGYEVSDTEGQHLDSCWGFIGDPEHVMSEGVGVAESRQRCRKGKIPYRVS